MYYENGRPQKLETKHIYCLFQLNYGRPLNEFSNSNIKYQNNEKLCINITHDTNCLYLDMTVLFLMHSSCLIVDVLTFESVINLW